MDERTTGTEEAAPQQSGKLLLILVAALSLAIGAGIGTAVLAPRIVGAVPAAAKAREGDSVHVDRGKGRDGAPAAMYSIENIVLNPAGTSGSRYLLLSVALVLSDPAAEAGARAREIEVRDRIVALLATQTVDRLIDPAQRDSIKDEIRSSVEPIFPKGVVRGVLLPQFVVQ
ncbi:MAG: hypothetical protein ABS52_16905 [Gemmatimonadetes bacterium SCN 70-22]|nr:MAG: hypothetical protein ABS52_16905 [Gemmatimonadetes bacterium SCN 70-22]